MLTSKLPQVGTSIFTRMSQLAQQHGAINLSQGFPDFSSPPELLELVCHYLQQGYNQYAPMAGVQKLREQISSKTHLLYGFTPDPDTEVTITSGATEALYVALAAILHPGDEVIVLEPAYDSYVPAILLNGGTPVFVSLEVPAFNINWKKVKAAITSRTKAIIINSPHNPSGAIITKHDLEILIQLISETNMYIISDEVYEHMVFDGQLHLSMLTKPELAARSFVISSFGKTYHATGWKVAYCIAPPALTTEFRKIHQYVTFSTVTPIQYALADYLEYRDHYLNLPAFYQAKRDLFCQLLQNSPFTFIPSAGTYFQLVSYKSTPEENDQAFAHRLTTDFGVAAIPVSVFYQQQTNHNLLRFCFAKNENTLRAAAEKLARL